MNGEKPDLLRGLLRDVSRSFYLTLRVLPAPVRRQIGLAYLLARTTDTIADTEIVPLDKRITALRTLSRKIAGENVALDLGEFSHQGTAAERVLLGRVEDALAVLAQFDQADRELIRALLKTIASGQELDLLRFDGAKSGGIIALQTDAELDDYTYRVAGCVGEFWTRICMRHLFARDGLSEGDLLRDGIQFGKGLQLVNILRDLPRDLQKGRCYLPVEVLRARGIEITDLARPEKAAAIRAVYDPYLDRAQAYLGAGWRYTLALPWRVIRVRLACAWPVLIGIETLNLLRRDNFLDPTGPVKVPRACVRSILRRSVLLYPFPGAWRALGPAAPTEH